MASQYPVHELNSAEATNSSTPNSAHNHDNESKTNPPPCTVRFMCSFNGQILPRPHDNQLRYVEGDTRIVSINRHSTTYASLLSKLSKLSCTTPDMIIVKYQLPNEDLDSLITVTADDDLENMLEEYDRLISSQDIMNKSSRLRVFLFPTEIALSRASSISSLSSKRASWFVEALNGGHGSVSVLERGRSEVSSIVSEVPDYLFGLDSSEIIKSKNDVSVSVSDTGSPGAVISSPFCSTSSSLAQPVMEHKESQEMVVEKLPVHQHTGYSGGPMWHYPNQGVYYMNASGHGHVQVQPGNVSVQTGGYRGQFVQQYQMGPGHVTVGFPGSGQVYGSGVRQYEMAARIYADNVNQGMYYGGRNVAGVPGTYPGVVVSGGEEMRGLGTDLGSGRVSK